MTLLFEINVQTYFFVKIVILRWGEGGFQLNSKYVKCTKNNLEMPPKNLT